MKEFIGGLFAFFDIKTTLVDEFDGVIHAIEEAKKMGLTSLWIECDFALVCVSFTARTNVFWILRNRWNTCLYYFGRVRFKTSHILHEGNACAESLQT